MMNTYHTILAEGNGGAVKLCQKEAGVQIHELTYRNSIQGQVWGRVCTTRQSPDFTEYGKCCGSVVKVHVLIRGDLLDMQLDRAAPWVATFMVIKKESAEAIVAQFERRAKHELGEGTDELL